MDSHRADPETVTLYRRADQLSPALWDDLAALNPRETAFRTGLPYDPDHGYRTSFLGVDYEIDPAAGTIRIPGSDQPCGFQAGLVLLTYLINAREDGLSGRMVTERELRGGDMFFKGPHELNRKPVLERFGRDAQAMTARAAAWGAIPAEGGDGGFRLLALPKIRVGYTLYEADEEFSAQLTITFDSSADRHLPLDGIWALINILSERLARG